MTPTATFSPRLQRRAPGGLTLARRDAPSRGWARSESLESASLPARRSAWLCCLLERGMRQTGSANRLG